MKIFLVIFLFFLVNISYSREDNINYNKIDKEHRIYLDRYLKEIELKMEYLELNLKTNNLLGKEINVAEEFLLDLEENDDENYISTELKNINIFNKDENKNVFLISLDKILKKDNNFLEIGIYGGGSISKIISEKLNSYNIGVNLNAKLLENGINLVILSEYNYDFQKTYNSKNLLGAIKLSLKKDLGDLVYLEPSIYSVAKYDLDTKLKFSNTDVLLDNKLVYKIGADIKLGIENEKEDNIYNIYVSLGMNKKMNNERFKFLFKNKNKFSEVEDLTKLKFNINLGSDLVINKNNKFTLNSAIIVGEKSKYSLNLAYKRTFE